MQVVVPIRQEPDLQRLRQILDVLSAPQHGRDHHQGAEFRRDPTGEVHPWQQVRRRQQRRQPVHQSHGELACAQQQQDAQQPEPPAIQSAAMRLCQQAPGENRRQQQDRARVRQQRKPANQLPKRLEGREADPLPFARAAANPCRSGRTRHVQRDRYCRFRRRPPAPAGSLRGRPASRTAGCASLSFPRRGGNGHGWQNPSCRRLRRRPRAGSVRQRSPFRRTRASPSRSEIGGCRCCC